MIQQASVGVPYSATPDQPVSEWSAAIYRALRNWAEDRRGQWAWWDSTPGYLVLTIDRLESDEIEPVVLHTWDEELTVELRHWDAHFPDWNSGPTDDPAQVAAQAHAVADSWLSGNFALAVYFADEKWCGSRTIEANEDFHSRMADIESIKTFGPTRVELRWADKNRLKHFTLSDGQIVFP